MAIGLPKSLNLSAVGGVRVGTAMLGGRSEPRDDLALIELEPGSRTAAAFTRNRFCAAPVLLARQHLGVTSPRYLLINAGNANAGTGEQGLEDAVDCCRLLARAAGCEPEEVLPFSTGVIGEPLAVQRFHAAIPEAVASLKADGWARAAAAIITTDTLAKGVSTTFEVGDTRCQMTGIVKGSGMIRPDMATMLAFVVTDAAVGPQALQYCLSHSVEATFNRITVDGDTSTNDACTLSATGASGAARIEDIDNDDFRALLQATREVCRELAQGIVRDGEGVTKFVTVTVEEGRTESECKKVAYAVAHSPLVKTAMFASDPNWGRILAAVGRSMSQDVDIERVRVYLDEVCIVENGGRCAAYREEDGQRVMDREDITVRIVLANGEHRTTVWTTDLSHDYVRINAEYRT